MKIILPFVSNCVSRFSKYIAAPIADLWAVRWWAQEERWYMGNISPGYNQSVSPLGQSRRWRQISSWMIESQIIECRWDSWSCRHSAETGRLICACQKWTSMLRTSSWTSMIRSSSGENTTVHNSNTFFIFFTCSEYVICNYNMYCDCIVEFIV